MYPIIFQYNNLIVSSFGLMMVVAFLSANYILKIRIYNERKYDSDIADDIIFWAAIGGILGAKIYYIIENIQTGYGIQNIYGLKNIFYGLITLNFNLVGQGIQNFGSGMVFYGGLVGGLITVSFYLRKKKINWYIGADLIAPCLALGHAIGRIGCLLVGDDWGKPTTLPWGIKFPNGFPPTSTRVIDDLGISYNKADFDLSNGINSILPVHPTQIYEMILYFIIFIYLHFILTRYKKFNGQIFYEYLFLTGLSRFVVEFYRVNPKYIYIYSGAQLISLVMIFISTFLMFKYQKIIKE